MLKLINKFFVYAKVFFLLVAFSFVLYIAFMKMDFTSSNLLTVLSFFIPFFCLLIIYVIIFFFNYNNDNILVNLSSLLAFIAILIISFRTIFDQNIVSYPAVINLEFFNTQEVKIKLLLYLIIFCQILLLFSEKRRKNKIHS